MSESRELIRAEKGIVQTSEIVALSRDQMDLIKQTVAKGATDDELKMFVNVCMTTGLNPFAKEIYFIKFKNRDGTETVAMPVGIDGFRRKAAESGDYAGQVGPFWCGPDGEWKDIWLSDQVPMACKVGVLRKDNPEPTWGVVKWSEFSKVGQKGDQFWRNMPTHMLAIAAERHALRKATPRLVEKLEAAGTQVMDADCLIAKAEEEEMRGREALVSGTPLSGDSETAGADEDYALWEREDFDKLQEEVEKRKLSSHEWRALLGLSEDAIAGDVMRLGTVDEVIAKLRTAFERAIDKEVGVQQLGF